MSDELSGIIDKLSGIHATKAAEMAIAEIEAWRRWQDGQPKLFEGFPEHFFSGEGDDMSEQLPEYVTGGAREYLVHWHNGENATFGYVLADNVFIDPDTNVLTLSLAGETQFFSQTWTSVFKSTNKPK